MNATGTLERHEVFPSRYVSPRNLDVWCPPGYAEEAAQAYPVLYMHDGQNLFDDSISYGSISWGVDRAMTRLLDERKIREAIVVGIRNSPVRWRDYMPQKTYEVPGFEKHHQAFLETAGGPPVSDAYLKFLVEEVKPFIDAHYRTLTGQKDTFVMGSSMGGLISLYAISEYPTVIGGAACISTHWPIGGTELVDEMARGLPDPSTHRLYFDFGTETLDSDYEAYQRRMDEHLRKAGYVENRNWSTRKFEGAEHSERSWRARVHIPLEFLLGQTGT
jgi:predicted alpha/beta superfamily hydrolase